ncbi:ABC transporter ATP-binding protein [Candidatus Aerophobetes bacterium]|nr:ABC transporter ATP-binding protein [Candidatus Aerophobetes bacterium]
MIRTKGLTKCFNGFTAVKDLNLNVRKGEIYGFLGPNGAGKTTTILMLLGILRPTKGEVYLFEKSLYEDYFNIKRRIGVVSEKQYLYEEMTAWEYLDFFSDFYQVKNSKKRIEELLEWAGLYGVKDKKLKQFSRGMQQKVGIARALLHNPEILILDEPISGLDPMGIKEVRDMIEEQKQLGKTIFISSHLLSEVEKICDRVGIVNKGVLLAEDKMENLKMRLSREMEIEIELKKITSEIIKALSSLDFVNKVTQEKNLLVVRVKTDKDHRDEIVSTVSSHKGVILGLKMREMSLEEAFVTITHRNVSLLAGG